MKEDFFGIQLTLFNFPFLTLGMKGYSLILGLTGLICFAACSDNSNLITENDSTDTTAIISNDQSELLWQTISADSLFEIELPLNMTEKADLNDDASLKYAFIGRLLDIVYEHYVIVITDTKAEIESYDLNVVFDAMSFSQAVVESVVEGYDTYEILTTEPAIENINGMDCVIYEIDAALGDVRTYHLLGVFEGEKAFYQVLTWTLLEQKSEFKDNMTHMIYSFREL